jgi:peptidoglycan-associated lipoprotein
MRTLAVVCLAGALAVGCASSGTPTDGGSATSGGSEFGNEGGTDPGMGSRSSMSATGGAVDFRNVYFDYDAYALRADGRDALQHNATILRSDPSVRVQIEGNCDERGSDEYNLALGKKRAEAAKRYLVDLGIEASRISTLSYGEENPAVRGNNEMAWAQNRRDEFKLR